MGTTHGTLVLPRPQEDFGTFGNKGARPAERRGAAGGGVAPQEGFRLVDEEAFLLRRRGLHGEDGGVRGFRAGAGRGAERAGVHRQRQLVAFQLREKGRRGRTKQKNKLSREDAT